LFPAGAAAQLTASPLSPADAASGVSQTPAFSAAALGAGSTVQYHFQLSGSSDFSSPLIDCDQTSAQTCVSGGLSGVFTGQNAQVSAPLDAYMNYASTGTLAFKSIVASELSPDTQYHWRVRVSADAGASYSGWAAARSFTTGRFASQNPVNNIAITDTSFSDATGASVTVSFTVWENNVVSATTPLGGQYNTADWIFIKFSTSTSGGIPADGSWKHATLISGSITGGTLSGALTVPSDHKGVYINHTASSSGGYVNASVRWNYAADGLTLFNAKVKVFAVSMVHIPAGSFRYGDGCVAHCGTGEADFYNVVAPRLVQSADASSDIPPGATPNSWPNGYSSFYLMRYSVTQGQYADYLNTVGSSTAAAHYTSIVANGHNIAYNSAADYGSRYSAGAPAAAENYLAIMDAWSYLSWAAMRPPTEMEFEKAARGDTTATNWYYPWGTLISTDTATYAPPNESGTCMRNYMNFNNLSGCQKVLDVGRYMSGDAYRTAAQTGASPYGLADMAGNVWNIVVNCAAAQTVPAGPSNGNGTPVEPASWPVPGSGAGTALRGGGWSVAVTNWLRISDRTYGNWVFHPDRSYDVGARGARTP